MKRRSAKLSADLFDEIIVDNFAGGGGASMGIEAALARCVDVAINHDRAAVEMHSINHPHTNHLCEDVWKVKPVEVVGGRPVGLAWFSPDCKHFSRAKGGKPVEKKIRGLAWIVLKWAGMPKPLRPRIIILENVREFEDWGPLDKFNMPCQKRKGRTFRRWVASIRNLGYWVEWRVLNAADYGAPTHRRRLFLIARRDGKPIVWPEPTHGPGRKPYRTAAECIDWTLPCPSIFLTKEEGRKVGVNRPLAEKTMRRIAMGLKKYVLDAEKPFIVEVPYGFPRRSGTCASVASGVATKEPGEGQGNQATVQGGAPGTCEADSARQQAAEVPVGSGDDQGSGEELQGQVPGKGRGSQGRRGRASSGRPDSASVSGLRNDGEGAGSPSRLLEASGCDMALPAVPQDEASPFLVRCAHGDNSATGSQRWGRSSHPLNEPLPTVTASKDFAAVTPYLAARYGEAPHQDTRGQKADEPLNTITATNNSGVLVAPALVQYNGEKGQETRAQATDDPLKTVTTENRFGVVSAFLAKHYGGVVGHDPDRPLGTVTAVDHHSVVAAHLMKFRGESPGSAADAPMPTITSGAGSARPAGAAHALGVVTPFMQKICQNGSNGSRSSAADEPARTIVSKNEDCVVAAHLSHLNHGEKQWSGCDEPTRTQTTANHAALVYAFLVKYYGCGTGQQISHPMHTVTVKDRMGLVTVNVGGEPYVITDIGLRMLTPRELARAQGFPDSYVLTGTKSSQVARIGNSVCPTMAEALVRANCAEMSRPTTRRRASRRRAAA